MTSLSFNDWFLDTNSRGHNSYIHVYNEGCSTAIYRAQPNTFQKLFQILARFQFQSSSMNAANLCLLFWRNVKNEN